MKLKTIITVFLAVFDALQDRDAFERPIEMPLFTEKEQEARLEPIPPKQDAGARVEITDKIPEATEEVSRPEPVFRAVQVIFIIPHIKTFFMRGIPFNLLADHQFPFIKPQIIFMFLISRF